MSNKIILTIPEQKITMEIGEEFQIKGNIFKNSQENKFLLLPVINEPELFIIFEEHFGDNKKHWIENTITFDHLKDKYGFGWNNVSEAVTLNEINKYETGDTILWSEAEQKFITGTKTRDIYFPEEPPIINRMKAVWASLVDVTKLKEAGFNEAISYLFKYRSEELQLKTLNSALDNGMKIIPVLHHYWADGDTDGAIALVNKWKNHSALGGWMMFDEPRISKVSATEQKKFYDKVKKADPDHIFYTTFMADPLGSDYYDPNAFDMAMVDYYPIRGTGDWREFIKTHLDNWISSTGNKNIIPILQGFGKDMFEGAGVNDFINPIGTINEQYGFWKERGLVANGYGIYMWEPDKETHSPGTRDIPGLLDEVKEFNKK